MPQIYYGTKKIKSQAMTRQQYNDYRGWDLPENENGDDLGFLVEYVDGGKSNDERHEGYISWSPKDVFERSYQPETALNFGHALAALKEGHKVARSGWNGKDMWIARTFGSVIPSEKFWNTHNRQFAEENGGSAQVLDTITMKTATGEILMGWLASQTDMMAEDWVIVS